MIRPLHAALVAAITVAFGAMAVASAAPCPAQGGSLRVALVPPPDGGPVTAIVAGSVTMPSCNGGATLTAAYFQQVTCQPAAPDSCTVVLNGLQPGTWLHRIGVTAGEALGQAQGRAALVLDATAGSNVMRWPLYRSVHTVTTLADSPDCVGCLRAAIIAAELGHKPALVQFADIVAGTIVLTAAPPPLAAGQVTIDGFAANGAPWTRTIDANGLNAAAIRITGDRSTVTGLRVVGVGGDSDSVLMEGVEANGNVIDTVEVVGRSLVPCGSDGTGCVIAGVCRQPTAQNPRGFCGDDGIAVRAAAGTGVAGPNVIRNSMISGAHDKGVKVSDGGVAVIDDSVAFANTDGGLQATLGGTLTARHNVVYGNHGTVSANGIAANGAAVGSEVPARLTTRGNLSIANAQRGISVRSLSRANLDSDFLCGNGTAGRGGGFGVAALDAADRSASVTAHGLGVVHNADGGVVVTDSSTAQLGTMAVAGENAIAFNGVADPPTPVNFQNLTALPIAAIGNAWEHCGSGTSCDVDAVQALDVLTAHTDAPVGVAPALPTRMRARPSLDRAEPSFAAAGTLVRLYGSGFDAIEGAGASCVDLPAANSCSPLSGNCVLVDRTAADVVAVTPTMLVIRMPFTCVAPVTIAVRTHWGHGFARLPFCVIPPDDSTE